MSRSWHARARGRRSPKGAGKTTQEETESIVSKIGVMSTRQGLFSKDHAFGAAERNFLNFEQATVFSGTAGRGLSN